MPQWFKGPILQALDNSDISNFYYARGKSKFLHADIFSIH